MYGAYVVNLEDIEPIIRNEPAKSIYNEVKTTKIIKTLEDILCEKKDFLNADDLCNLFFPFVECPVFLSHSGQNKNNVQKFAQWLKKEFEINSFVDSDLWGCIADLQYNIDVKFSRNDDGKFDYNKRNYSTAHVHMMLSHALTQMINRTECFIFLKSSASISIQDTQKGTFSPWVFHELATVDTIRKKRSRGSLPKEKSGKSIGLFSRMNENLNVFYPVPFKKLIPLVKSDIEKWDLCCSKGCYGSLLKQIYEKKCSSLKKWEESLNWLYENFPPKRECDESTCLL